MNRPARFVVAAGAAFLLAGGAQAGGAQAGGAQAGGAQAGGAQAGGAQAGGAQAGVSLNAGRVGAVDVAALAKFYESAFGLKEVNRLQFPGMLEIMMNFGDTAAAAKANRSAQIVIMHRTTNAIKDPVPHLILDVTNIDATAAAIEAAGGKMMGKPRPFGHTGMVIGMAMDPAGNRLELIQPPHH